MMHHMLQQRRQQHLFEIRRKCRLQALQSKRMEECYYQNPSIADLELQLLIQGDEEIAKNLLKCMPAYSLNEHVLFFLIQNYRLSQNWILLICYYSDRFSIDLSQKKVKLILFDFMMALQQNRHQLITLAIWFIANYLADGGETDLRFDQHMTTLSLNRLTLYCMNKSSIVRSTQQCLQVKEIVEYCLQFDLNDMEFQECCMAIFGILKSKLASDVMMDSPKLLRPLVNNLKNEKQEIVNRVVLVLQQMCKRETERIGMVYYAGILDIFQQMIKGQTLHRTNSALKLLANLCLKSVSCIIPKIIKHPLFSYLTRTEFPIHSHILAVDAVLKLIRISNLEEKRLMCDAGVLCILSKISDVNREVLKGMLEGIRQLWKAGNKDCRDWLLIQQSLERNSDELSDLLLIELSNQ